jgi:hypothetical protein
MNLVSTITFELRQLYKKAALSAIGLFDVSFFQDISPVQNWKSTHWCIFTTY